MSDDAESLIKHHEFLWGQQANFRMLWNTIASYVLPAWDNFIGEWSEGINRNQRIFDSTAITANERFAAAMEQMLTPRTQQWHTLTTVDPDLNADLEVAAYLDQVTKILFASRYRPQANFASQADECYMSLGAFGNAAMFTDEIVGKGIRYRSVPLSEIVWAMNHAGFVDTVYRKFKFSAKQAVNQWGKKCSESIQKQYSINPYAEMEFLHCVKPNDDYKERGYGYEAMSYESWYLCLKDRSVIERAGYRSFPYAISRYRLAPREHYGRGPAVAALPHIRTLNEQKKTALRAGSLAVEPPLLLMEEGALTPFNLRPGALNYGTLSADGTPLVQPLQMGGKLEVAEKLMEMEASSINDSFLTTLFQILVQTPEMTATEALIRAQEKGEMIAPAMGRQQSEFLGPLIVRELDILQAAGQLPPAPPQLAGKGGIKIEYTSPLTRAMRAQDGTAIMNTIQAIGTMANLDKSVLNLLDFVDAGRELAMINGCPPKLLRTNDQITELMQHQADQAQQQQALQSAPQVSMAAKNLSQAQLASAQAAQAGQGGQGA
jgi:hypothetical protein